MSTNSTLDQIRRGVLWAMIASLALGGLLGTILLLMGVGDANAWRVEITLFALALHCGAAVLYLRGQHTTRNLWKVALPTAICTGNLLLLIVCTWITTHRQEHAWVQTMILIAAGVLLVPATTLLRKRTVILLANAGVLTVLGAAFAALAHIWINNFRTYNSAWDRAVASAAAIAVGVALAEALYAWRPHPALRWLRIAACIFIAMATAMIVTAVIENTMWNDEFYQRITIVFSLLSVCCVLINAVAILLLRPESASAAARAAIDLELRCPKCGEELTLPSGASACPYCKTRFEIRVLPSACLRCGYDLTALREPICPECGSAY